MKKHLFFLRPNQGGVITRYTWYVARTSARPGVPKDERKSLFWVLFSVLYCKVARRNVYGSEISAKMKLTPIPKTFEIYSQITKFFLGASPPDPSYLLPVYIQLLPLIYPFYQYSPDPKISPHYRANIKNFLGGFAPRVQTTSDILPPYIQLCPQTPS